MDILDEDLLNFWRSLNSFGVKYILIGDFAVTLHGFSRVSTEVAIWLKDEIDNRQRLGEALEQFGYGKNSFEEINFVPGWSDLFIGSGIRLDILTTMVGLENISFDEAFQEAYIANIEAVSVPFLHINQLIQNKKTTGRPKDLIDVIELEKIIELNKKT